MRSLNFVVGGLWILVYLVFTNGCTKPPDNNQPPTVDPPVVQPPPVVPPGPPQPVIDSKWECEIDGVAYSGTIDTSLLIDPGVPQSNPDTILVCTGTSSNKKLNIYFRININRKYRTGPIPTRTHATMAVDTLSTRFLISSSVYTNSNIDITVDTLVSGKLKATFSGTLTLPFDGISGGETNHTVKNGKFNCEIGKGNLEPKSFSFSHNNEQLSGYFSYSRIESNTLIMDGCLHSAISRKFRIGIRTNGTIKPGIYENTDGNAGVYLTTSSVFSFYFNDVVGKLKVLITSVNGDIIHGRFTGTDDNGKPITDGWFSTRVKDYRPQQDSINKWGLNYDETIFNYTMLGGNVLNAVRSHASGKYYLTVNGESDHGDSKFKLVIKSNTPIAKGIYETGSFSHAIDSLEFRSNTKLWNGNSTHLTTDYRRPAICRIDSIDASGVTGTLYGNITIELSPNALTSAEITNGRFRANF